MQNENPIPFEWGNAENDSNGKDLGPSTVQIGQSLLLSSYIETSFAGHPDSCYVFNILVEFEEVSNDPFGIYLFQQDSLIAYHVLNAQKSDSLVEMGFKFISADSLMDLKIGWPERGLSKAKLHSISIKKANQAALRFRHPFANYLSSRIELEPFDSLNYHANVLKISDFVNRSLILPLNRVYGYKGSEQERTDFRIMQDSLKLADAKPILSIIPESDFKSYIQLPILEMSSSYCVKSSVSSYELLSYFNIPTRQIHLKNSEGIAIHQCYDYWHPYLGKWVIIDPFYGITYSGKDGELLGYEEFYKAILEDSSYIELNHELINPFYFNLEELHSAWYPGAVLGSTQTSQKSMAF